LVELAGRIKDLFSVKRLVYHSELHSDTECAAKQFLFIGILQIDMCIDEKPDSFGKDDHPDAMIGLPYLQRHIRIDEEGSRRPVDPDILQTGHCQHIQVSRNTRICRIIVTQRHKILAQLRVVLRPRSREAGYQKDNKQEIFVHISRNGINPNKLYKKQTRRRDIALPPRYYFMPVRFYRTLIFFFIEEIVSYLFSSSCLNYIVV